MTLRIAKTYQMGIAAALALGFAGTATAQVPARSDTRLPVRPKDAGGEVVAARVDTVTNTIYRTDTVRVYRTDTLRMTGPTVTTTNTVTRYDTTRIEMTPGWLHRPYGTYFGLGGGPTFAQGSISEAQNSGRMFQAQIGVDPKGSPLGLRFDANFGQPNQARPYEGTVAHSQILNLSGDLKLRAPYLNSHIPLSLYAIGGGNYIRYKDLLIQLDTPTPGTYGNNVAPSDNVWHDKWGYNAGAGLDYGWGKYSLFVESRMISFKAANANTARQFPLVIGFNWY